MIEYPPKGYWVRRSCGYSHDEAFKSQRKIRVSNRIPQEKLNEAHELLKGDLSQREVERRIGYSRHGILEALERQGIVIPVRPKKGRPRSEPSLPPDPIRTD